jgi:hypothetical protein
MSTSETLPEIQAFCVAVPLYAEFRVQHTDEDAVYALITEAASIDCFCVDCDQPSVFLGAAVDIGVPNYEFHLRDRTFTRAFFCSRLHDHWVYFHFRLKDQVLSKIGQSPSIADISESQLRPYRKVLTNEDYGELTRAVGLASHGGGIGSFVYLRRIFERLIHEAAEVAATGDGWDPVLFQQSRMEEKIRLLQNFLPSFLVEQRQLYSILSKGIHALTETECLESFPIVRAGIELILDQKVAAKQQRDKMDEAKKHLTALKKKITEAQ